MSWALAYPIAVGAALPTTLAVLAALVLRARAAGEGVETVLLPTIFLYVPLIFFVSIAANVGGATAGLVTGAATGFRNVPAMAAAGVLVWAFTRWTARGVSGGDEAAAPLVRSAILTFAAIDMLILGGGLMLLPQTS